MVDVEHRIQVCRSLGFGSIVEAHETIVAGAKTGPARLLQKGLNARTLASLGYDAKAMMRLGYSPAVLKLLGYAADSAGPPSPQAPRQPQPAPSHAQSAGAPPDERLDLQALVAQGHTAAQLHQMGVTVHHCRTAGLSARDLYRVGFQLDELVAHYPLAELRNVGFGPRELARSFSGAQLRTAGFAASEMRQAGYSIRDLLSFGYNENHIRTAGYSMHDLTRAGITKHIEEKGRFGGR
jgi:intracellular multiplication protein IcmE